MPPNGGRPPILPAQRPYTAYGAAAAMWADRSAEVVMEGPAGTGKSRAILEKIHYCAMKYPGMRALLARKTRESMTESVLVTYELKVLPEGSPIAAGAGRASRQAYHYSNGSTVVVGGLTQHGQDTKARIMSTEYDLIAVFEATELSEHDWEQLTTRLRNGVMPYQQIIGDCNPDAPTHWLHQRCDQGVARVHFSRHTDNPSVTPEYLKTLSRLTGHRRERLYLGRRAAAEGLIYDMFDPAIHVRARFPIPPDWTRFRAIDFGFTNPFVCQWWAVDHDGRLFRYREIYMSGRTVSQHAPTIRRESDGQTIAYTVADHDAEDRATLAGLGIPTVAAHKAVSQGIQAVQDRLKIADDGQPRLYFVQDSLVEQDQELVRRKVPWTTEQELDGYSWPKGQDGKPMKEDPIKLNDHGCDTLRYAVMSQDGNNTIRSVADYYARRAAARAAQE